MSKKSTENTKRPKRIIGWIGYRDGKPVICDEGFIFRTRKDLMWSLDTNCDNYKSNKEDKPTPKKVVIIVGE